MPDILHRFTIGTTPEHVHDLIASKDGVERWWTGHPNTQEDDTLRVFFGGSDPAATMQIAEDTPERIVWRVLDGPADWIGTTVTFALQPRPDGGTTLLFTHADWRETNEFMLCATSCSSAPTTPAAPR